VRLPIKKPTYIFLIFAVVLGTDTRGDSRLITYDKAKPRLSNALVQNWIRFNGPYDNATTKDTSIALDKNKFKIKKIWELSKGEGYASPAIFNNHLILFHLQNGFEIIESRDAETGKIRWSHKYPAEYRDRYGYSNGPRASPLIWDGCVYAHGVTAWLTCLELETGKLLWERDLKKEFLIPDYFFGKGSNPIVSANSLILNIGGQKNDCVAGFDLKNGKTLWITKDAWGASYSSPVKAKINGRDTCIFFTGGESRPPTGGLLILDSETGQKLARFPWRSKMYESANASPPVVVSQNRVFISECYEKGGVLVEFDENFSPKIIWHKPELNVHWMTPIYHEGLIFGVSGRHQRGAAVFCVEAKTGLIRWKERVSWKDTINDQVLNLELFRGSILKINDYYLALSEIGSLILLNMDENGWNLLGKQQLFFAPGTWTLPALSNGLLYVMQNEKDRMSGMEPRVLCFDLRKP